MNDTSIIEMFKPIRLLALDFDGVMTDGMVIMSSSGEEMVRCSRRDSLGINILKNAGIEVMVLTKETSPVVSKRCEKLKIPCIDSLASGSDKRDALIAYAAKMGIGAQAVAFVGDDIQDIPALIWAGAPCTVSDAHPAVLEIAKYRSPKEGGNHAVRDICDRIIEAQSIEQVVR